MRFKSGFSAEDRGAKCSFCGSNARPLDSCDPNGPHERVITNDIQIDFEGFFSFCETCGREIARLIGYVPAEHLSEAENDVLRWQDTAQDLDGQLTHARQMVDLLTSELAGAAHKTATAYAAGYDAATVVDEEPDFAGHDR